MSRCILCASTLTEEYFVERNEPLFGSSLINIHDILSDFDISLVLRLVYFPVDLDDFYIGHVKKFIYNLYSL